MTRHIPTGYAPHTVNDLIAVYSKPLENGGVVGIAYIGKRSKAAWHWSFKTADRMEEQVKNSLTRLTRWEESKIARRNERKGELTQTQVIKKALTAQYPYKISVTKGKGTAAAWISVDVEGTEGDSKKREAIYSEVYKVIKLALAKASEETGKDYGLSSYCSDDGYNADRDCLLLRIL